jgi:hypothetical protein
MKPIRAYKNLGELVVDMFPMFKTTDEIKKQEVLQVQSLVTKLEGKGYDRAFFAPGDIKGTLESHQHKIIQEGKVPPHRRKVLSGQSLKTW